MFRSSVHFCLGLLLLIAAVDASAQQKSPKGGIIVQGERLADGDAKNPDTRKIWLVSANDPSQRELLFTHQRAADVVFSSDESWLVINDHLASNQSDLLLYKRTAGLRYESVVELSGPAWSFFWKKNGGETQFGFDHHYVECVQWLSKQPNKILLALRGHMDSRNHADDWRCLYDTETRTFCLNNALRDHNKGRAVIEHR